jgi:hypothetical protein
MLHHRFHKIEAADILDSSLQDPYELLFIYKDIAQVARQ